MTQLLREKEMITIDYPNADETIAASQYTIRVGVPEDAELVEVSIDGSPWQVCRPAVGYWWYDWSDYLTGRHQLMGRVRLRDGEVYTTSARTFRVEFGKSENRGRRG